MMLPTVVGMMLIELFEGSRLSLQLRYPAARLALLNRLLSSGDCVSAFVDSAVEFGLAQPEELSGFSSGADGCAAFAIAEAILRLRTPVSDKLSKQLKDEIEQYQRQKNQNHICAIGDDPSMIGCSGMAPVVMDFLLQLLEPYSAK
jgi:hypothetical protein